MRFILLPLILFITSCASRISTTEFRKEADETRVTLMRQESDVYGNFFKLRIFHTDLLQLTNNPEKYPFPSLDSLFKLMTAEANQVITQRLRYDTTLNKINALIEGKKKIKRDESNASLFESYDSLKHYAPGIQKQYAEKYFSLRTQYENITRANGIRRLSPADYAALLNDAVTMWLDSLEEIGRMTARTKLDLKDRFPAQKGADYFVAYQPISELEAAMKNFESFVAQLQNSLSRFEEGNPEDFIYFGKNVRQRMEVQATDGIISALALNMRDCREKELKYWKHYKR